MTRTEPIDTSALARDLVRRRLCDVGILELDERRGLGLGSVRGPEIQRETERDR